MAKIDRRLMQRQLRGSRPEVKRVTVTAAAMAKVAIRVPFFHRLSIVRRRQPLSLELSSDFDGVELVDAKDFDRDSADWRQPSQS